MPQTVEIVFASFEDLATRANRPDSGTLVTFAGEDLALSHATRNLLGSAADLVGRAATSARFKGKTSSAMDLLAPAGLKAARLLVAGAHPAKKPAAGAPPVDYMSLGGYVMGKANGAKDILVMFDLPDWAGDPAGAAADFMAGLKLRAYTFDSYKTKKAEDDEKPTAVNIVIGVSDPEAAERAATARLAVAEGVTLARTLVNEPPNVLFPVAFADRTKELEKLGVKVEVLDVAAMEALGMSALLGVGQGSIHDSRCVVMRWDGGKAGEAPVAFIGKGVTFDSGGISIKPAAGMEDMKGDMAGAACVVGLMHALAARKAKVNAIGAIGIVENMPGGKAQRPGDIVKTLSGQTIEIINTDAEGRLVLADVLWHVQDKFKPKFMVNLATLTGAILVALGTEYAGLFSNNDELAERLTSVGLATGEKVWRMPLGPAYDKLIDSKFADMKNTGGRNAGSITAAQLLQRFVNEVPWAHLDIAGTGMSSPQTDTNQSWGSGWGVRLLDRLVAEHYEG
jgi:leucyl aminopeptidase